MSCRALDCGRSVDPAAKAAHSADMLRGAILVVAGVAATAALSGCQARSSTWMPLNVATQKGAKPTDRVTAWRHYSQPQRTAYRRGYRACIGQRPTPGASGGPPPAVVKFLKAHARSSKEDTAAISGCLDGLARFPLPGSGITR